MRDPGTNPLLAKFLDRQRAVASCLTRRPLLLARVPGRTQTFRAFFAPEAKPQRLRLQSGGFVALSFSLSLTVSAVPEPFVIVEGYRYELLGEGEREFVAYHWHPGGNSPIHGPHVHIKGAPDITPIGAGEALARARFHWPTGHVEFAMITAFLLRELRVEPARFDWEAVIDGDGG